MISIMPVRTCTWHCAWVMYAWSLQHDDAIYVHSQALTKQFTQHCNISTPMGKVTTSDSCSEAYSITVASALIIFSVLPGPFRIAAPLCFQYHWRGNQDDWYGHKFCTNHTHPLCYKFLLRRTLLINKESTDQRRWAWEQLLGSLCPVLLQSCSWRQEPKERPVAHYNFVCVCACTGTYMCTIDIQVQCNYSNKSPPPCVQFK